MAKPVGVTEKNEYEKMLQDAEVPRCPICRKPMLVNNPPIIAVAYGMYFMVHLECQKFALEEAKRRK